MAEAVTLMDSVAKAQRRKFMQTNHYAGEFQGLDVSPKGASGAHYYTKGDPQTGAGGNGFVIELTPRDFAGSSVAASRMFEGQVDHPSLQYQYFLDRRYQSDNVDCFGINQAGRELCADFCGLDTPLGHCCNDGTAGFCS